MNSIKESLKSKNFVVNEFVLKNLNKLSISINEFLLLLFFINVKNELDLENIRKYLNFTDDESLNIFNSLISKKLIEVVMVKTDKGIMESISLDLFYDKLIMNTKEEEKESDIYSKFESEFGRTLSPMEYQTISNWIFNKIPEEMILKALKESVVNGVTSLRYIDKILYEWNKKSVKNNYEELFDYDWLDEE